MLPSGEGSAPMHQYFKDEKSDTTDVSLQNLISSSCIFFKTMPIIGNGTKNKENTVSTLILIW